MAKKKPRATKKPTAGALLRRIAQLDEDEQLRLLGEIVSNPVAPLHNSLSRVLRTGLHAMKVAVRAFVLSRDRPAKGGRLWAATVLHHLKRQCSWTELLQKVPDIPEAVQAVKILSPQWNGEALWIEDGLGPRAREPEHERIRKAIRDLDRHARAKTEKAAEVQQLAVAALPPWFRESFPEIENHLKIF
jgi:hypothetical protein